MREKTEKRKKKKKYEQKMDKKKERGVTGTCATKQVWTPKYAHKVGLQ